MFIRNTRDNLFLLPKSLRKAFRRNSIRKVCSVNMGSTVCRFKQSLLFTELNEACLKWLQKLHYITRTTASAIITLAKVVVALYGNYKQLNWRNTDKLETLLKDPLNHSYSNKKFWVIYHATNWKTKNTRAVYIVFS